MMSAPSFRGSGLANPCTYALVLLSLFERSLHSLLLNEISALTSHLSCRRGQHARVVLFDASSVSPMLDNGEDCPTGSPRVPKSTP